MQVSLKLWIFRQSKDSWYFRSRLHRCIQSDSIFCN